MSPDADSSERLTIIRSIGRMVAGLTLKWKLMIPVIVLLCAMALVVGIGSLGVYRISVLNGHVIDRHLQHVLLANGAKSSVEEGRVYAALAAAEPDVDRRAFFREVAADSFERASDGLRALAVALDGQVAATEAARLAGSVVDYARATLPRSPGEAPLSPDSAAEIVRALTRIDLADSLQALVDAAETEVRLAGATVKEIRDETIVGVVVGAVMAFGVALWISVWMLSAHVEAPVGKIRDFLLGLARFAGPGEAGSTAIAGPADLLSQKVPLLDRSDEFGDIARAIEIARDRSVAVLQDLSQTRETLIQQERMAALGRLVAGVAHEINTPLGVSIMTASFLADIVMPHLRGERVGRPEGERERDVEQIQLAFNLLASNLERAGRLVQSFKNVSADQHHGTARRFLLRGYVAEVVESVRPEVVRMRRSVKLLDGVDIGVIARPDALWQILSNLIINAATHAYEDGAPGRITVDLRVEGALVSLVVADDGRGMAPETQAKIFEPFFTTRRDQGGVGLGLAISYNLAVDVLKGRLSCISEPGKGTSFTLTFPQDPAQVVRPEAAPRS